MAVSSLLVIFVITVFVNTVNGDCVYSLQEINPALVSITEIENDTVLLNTSNLPGLIWDFTLTTVDTETVTDKTLQNDLFNNFINISVSDTRVQLRLLQPLNTEYFCQVYSKKLNSFVIGITCKDTGNPTPIPLSFTVSNIEVDEKKPEFKTQPLSVTIPESTQVGTTLMLINNTLKDDDCPPNIGLNTIRLTDYTADPQVNGMGIVEIRLGSVGDVVLKQKVDFDQEYAAGHPVYYKVNVRVTDPQNRLTTTTLRINIEDVNDLPPAFDEFTYKSHTSITYRGKLTITPSAIHAVDQDRSINCSIIYSIAYGGMFSHAFEINPTTGELSQIMDVLSPAEIIQIQATENCPGAEIQLSRTVPILITLNNNTVHLPPEAGKSTAEEGSDFKLILIIIGVVALVVIIALLVGFVFYYKRMSRAVSPDVDRPESPRTEEEDLDTDRSGSKEVLIDPMLLPTPTGKKGRLEPLPMKSTGTETDRKKKRSRRRKKNKEPDIYDGTREYEQPADPAFFNSTQKDKIKRSTRSKDNKTTEPNRRINVENE